MVQRADVQLIEVLAVALGGPHRIELQAVLGVDLEGAGKVVGPGVGPGCVATELVGVEAPTLIDPVAGLSDDGAGEGELVVEFTRGEREGLLEEPPGPELLLVAEARVHLRWRP